MKITCSWIKNMQLGATDGTHSVAIDAKSPGGDDSALNPKQLVLSGLCGCTAMDVLSLLKKTSQPLESFEVVADAEMSAHGHPKVFTKISLTFMFKGALDAAQVIDSVKLSQTKYCGVSAMLSQAAPIHYNVLLNGVEVTTGEAGFSKNESK